MAVGRFFSLQPQLPKTELHFRFTYKFFNPTDRISDQNTLLNRSAKRNKLACIEKQSNKRACNGKIWKFTTKLIATLFGTLECKNAFDSDERM